MFNNSLIKLFCEKSEFIEKVNNKDIENIINISTDKFIIQEYQMSLGLVDQNM